jgi:hypothetical protein
MCSSCRARNSQSEEGYGKKLEGALREQREQPLVQRAGRCQAGGFWLLWQGAVAAPAAEQHPATTVGLA